MRREWYGILAHCESAVPFCCFCIGNNITGILRADGAYFRKMAIDGYILVVDRSDTKAYIRELQAVSRNINQIAKRANATGTVYRQDIEDIKKAVDEIWRLQRRTLLNQP